MDSATLQPADSSNVTLLPCPPLAEFNASYPRRAVKVQDVSGLCVYTTWVGDAIELTRYGYDTPAAATEARSEMKLMWDEKGPIVATGDVLVYVGLPDQPRQEVLALRQNGSLVCLAAVPNAPVQRADAEPELKLLDAVCRQP